MINPNPRDLLNHLLAVSFSGVPEDVITTNVAGQILLNLKTNIPLKISIAVIGRDFYFLCLRKV